MTKDLEIPFDQRTAQLPTFLINRTTVFANGQMVRLTFGEGFPVADQPYAWRMAIAMTLDDAAEMAEVVLEIVAEQRRRIAAMGAAVNKDGTVMPQGSA